MGMTAMDLVLKASVWTDGAGVSTCFEHSTPALRTAVATAPLIEDQITGAGVFSLVYPADLSSRCGSCRAAGRHTMGWVHEVVGQASHRLARVGEGQLEHAVEVRGEQSAGLLDRERVGDIVVGVHQNFRSLVQDRAVSGAAGGGDGAGNASPGVPENGQAAHPGKGNRSSFIPSGARKGAGAGGSIPAPAPTTTTEPTRIGRWPVITHRAELRAEVTSWAS